MTVAGRLRAGIRLLLRPSGTLPRLSWRGQAHPLPDAAIGEEPPLSFASEEIVE
jgi:hypothetical protein